jgi:hypothetical protein
MGRCVVLHFFTWGELVASSSLLFSKADSVTPAEGCERRIGKVNPSGLQFLPDPDQIAPAFVVKPSDLIDMGSCLGLPFDLRHFKTPVLKDPPDRVA